MGWKGGGSVGEGVGVEEMKHGHVQVQRSQREKGGIVVVYEDVHVNGPVLFSIPQCVKTSIFGVYYGCLKLRSLWHNAPTSRGMKYDRRRRHMRRYSRSDFTD